MTLARTARLAALAVLLALAAAGCGSAAATPSATSDCEHWCGNATAAVVFEGQTSTVSGGGCYDAGSAGIDVRIGDWQGEGVGDFLQLTGYRPGGPTQGPTVAPTDDSGNPELPPAVVGSVGGMPFDLGPDAIVTFENATSGKFSGSDVNGYGDVTGTFTCG
jgi:hypothetical protein